MARKSASRSNFASTTNLLMSNNVSSPQANSPSAAYSPPATVNMAGGSALSPGNSVPTSTMSVPRKRAQPKSKNHGRFPCSIPGCFAVANHLSSMCRHKWGHLPQRLLPACRGHLPNGAPCPVRYQGRADTMKRHWLTHHSNEGAWIPDRYPPFEDLWKLVRDGEIVLTPPSKYAYDAPLPEDSNTAPTSTSSYHAEVSGRRNSIGPGSRTSALSDLHMTSSIAARRNSFGGRVSPGNPAVRLSRGNNRPWKYSELVGDEDASRLDDLEMNTEDEYGDVEMGDVTQEDDGGHLTVRSPSHQSVPYSPARSHFSRSQRSNSNPRSPASLHSAVADHDIHIHVPPAIIQPITPRTSSSGESIIAHRYPLLPASNYAGPPISSVRDQLSAHDGPYTHKHAKSKSFGALGLLANSAIQEHRHIYDPENDDPNSRTLEKGSQYIRMNFKSYDVTMGQYVYGHKKGSPPGPGYTPASIPHSELSLLSHPPTDRILPSSSGHASAAPINDRGAAALPSPEEVNADSSPFAYSYPIQGTWHPNSQNSLNPPMTVTSH